MSDAPPLPDGALSSPAVGRNAGPIRTVLAPLLRPGMEVLEIAAGSGEHAAIFSRVLPGVRWRPTDPDPEARRSIEAWRDAHGGPDLLPPLDLDAARPETWPRAPFDGPYDGVVAINMIHISPWAATRGLMMGSSTVLKPGGFLFLYGPYLEAATPLAESNAAFDRGLKARDADWGLRDLETVKAVALDNGLSFEARHALPANNLALIFRKR